MQVHAFAGLLIPYRGKVAVSHQLFLIGVLHGEIEQGLGSVECIYAARAPGGVVDETESLTERNQLVTHEIDSVVAEDEPVDKVELRHQAPGIILHAVDLIEDALRRELLIFGNRRQKSSPCPEVELVRRHAGIDVGLCARSVAHGTGVAGGAVQIHDINAPHIAPRHAKWEGIGIALVASLVDHAEGRVALVGSMIGQLLRKDFGERDPDPVWNSVHAFAASGAALEKRNLICIVDGAVAGETLDQVKA